MVKSMILTDVVPAAASSGAPDPVALKQIDFPLLATVVWQRIRSQVTDLDFIVVGFEVPELHPATQQVMLVHSTHPNELAESDHPGSHVKAIL